MIRLDCLILNYTLNWHHLHARAMFGVHQISVFIQRRRRRARAQHLQQILNACGPFWSRLGPWHEPPQLGMRDRDREAATNSGASTIVFVAHLPVTVPRTGWRNVFILWWRLQVEVKTSRYEKFVVVINEFNHESTFDQMNLFVDSYKMTKLMGATHWMEGCLHDDGRLTFFSWFSPPWIITDLESLYTVSKLNAELPTTDDLTRQRQSTISHT